jgi:hypothetical protein
MFIVERVMKASRGFFIMFAVVSLFWADHDLDIYSFDDLFVFDTFTHEGRLFNIVVLNDADSLKIDGQIETNSNHNVDGYANYKNLLIVLLMNRVEVYDLNDPSQPILIKTIVLKEQGPYPRGYKGIVQKNNTYLLLSCTSIAQLTVTDDTTEWQIVSLGEKPKYQKEDFVSARFPPFKHQGRYPWPFIVRETPNFRYEVDWEVGAWEGYARMHKKYLRKIRKEDGKIVSSLFLGEHMETGGE